MVDTQLSGKDFARVFSVLWSNFIKSNLYKDTLGHFSHISTPYFPHFISFFVHLGIFFGFFAIVCRGSFYSNAFQD